MVWKYIVWTGVLIKVHYGDGESISTILYVKV